MSNDRLLEIKPHNPSTGETMWKIIIWIIIWLMIAFFIFVILVLVWSIFESALNSVPGWVSTINPLMPLILIVIGFLSSFLWNIVVSWVYNLLFPGKYYDLGKMFSLTLINNIILFFIFTPLYIIFYNDIEKLFVILAFHVFFSVYVWHSGIEYISNPNYCGVYLIWWSFWFALTILVFTLVYKSMYSYSVSKMAQILLSLPPLLGYTIIPMASNLWEKLYYKFYENWNNFLYIPSISEILVDEVEEDEINVDQ